MHWHARWVWLSVWVVGFGLVGCGEEQTFQTTGKLEYQNKAVFPATFLLRDEKGEQISANVDDAGKFVLNGVKPAKYTGAVQVQELSNVGRPTDNQAAEAEKEDGEKRREANVPAKFKNAFVEIPEKFKSFETSGLSFDLTTGVPTELTVELK